MRSSENSGRRDGKVLSAPAVARTKPASGRRRVIGGVELVAPVVEVAGDDQRLVARHLALDEARRAAATWRTRLRVDQAEVGDDRVHRVAVPRAPARAAGRAARSGGRTCRRGRCRRSASATAARCRARRRGSSRWSGRRPRSPRAPGSRPAARFGQPILVSGKWRAAARFMLPHLLQEDDVGVERLDAEAEVVDLEPPRRPDARTPLWML